MNTSIVGKKIKDYPKKKFSHAAVAIDVTFLRVYKKELQILLLELDEEPFIGKWALPGGLVTKRENLEKASLRHLKNKVGLKKDVYIEQLYSFGDPKRDPLGWVVSISHLALTNNTKLALKAAGRYKSTKWFSVKDLPSLAYDHEKIVKVAVKRLVSKIEYTNIIRFLIKEQFTMSELQGVYEVLLGKSVDKRNFRKKILNLKILKPLQKFKKEKVQRPARLYSFNTQELTEAAIL